MKEVVIVGGLRTPVGNLGGKLKDIKAHELGAFIVKALIKKYELDVNQIDEIIFGCVGQTSEAPNIARVIALLSGIPDSIPAFTVHRNCASSIQAIISATQMIKSNDADLIICGGVESMSNLPYVVKNARFGYRLRHGEFTDYIWECLTDPVCGMIMGLTAEKLAEIYNITRQEQDQFALSSHKKAIMAIKSDKFKNEIVPIAPNKRKPEELFSIDEGPDESLTLEKLAKAPTVFKKDGTVTPGNACSISDGASCVLVMSKEKAKSLGYEPWATITGYATAGVDPSIMGVAPAYSIPKALKKAGLNIDQIDLFEINEAFAAQYIAVDRQLKKDGMIIPSEKLNVNGGGIALGHAVGSTGCRLVVTLLHEMRRQNLKKGLASLCVGGGLGSTIILER